MEHKKREETCRLLVVGSHRARLNKVYTILDDLAACSSHNIAIEYLACIAKFSSYKDVASGEPIRYLSSVEYLPRNPVNGDLSSSTSSLLPFFDEETPDDEEIVRLFPRISGAVIGCGIEGPDDTARIESFLNTMASNSSLKSRVKIKTIEPNIGFRSMKEELAAYKALNEQEKEDADRLQTMGPTKMAKFIRTFADELIFEVVHVESSAVLEHNSLQPEEESDHGTEQPSVEPNAPCATTLRTIDTSNDRFTCRICRTILFGVADLQYPAHEPSQQMFSYRKRNHGSCTTSPNASCRSYFLQDCHDWMGDGIFNGFPEGKFTCPCCQAKLGSWIWSGTQCSCGSWVVPAIQIPKGKVDVLHPPSQTVVPASHSVEQELADGTLSEGMQSLNINP